MTAISMQAPSVNSESVVTNSGPQLTKALLQGKAESRMSFTVADASATSYLWSTQVGQQYPSILDMPRRSMVAAEHLLGLVRSLQV
ncbi:hypothetical protein [Desulfocurvus sp.]|jgi:hypothetical protein|uniref:hypothetical protein n=1 Tax=Desulfocurvus sp. TaxID=2871698 RepID=UPI0025BA22F2|nr:hypothetical protein [Desulfocurvus sp.]MCK9240088.1 hypothetical protein [Desulfocurvus sp.]